MLGKVRTHILGLTRPTTVNVMKQAYMAYKSRLNIIAEVYWLKIKTFIFNHSIVYSIVYSTGCGFPSSKLFDDRV